MSSNKLIWGVVFGLLVLGIGTFSIMDAFAALDSKGTEFLIAFQANNAGGGSLQVHITGDVATTATINYPSNNPTFSTSVNIIPNQITIVNIPATAQNWPAGQIANNAVKVTAPQEVTVYTTNLSRATSDAALALPVDAFSFKYIATTFSSTFQYSQFIVVSQVDNNQVTIIPSVSLISGQQANTPFTITLNKGEGFSARTPSTQDLSGSIITADKPIGLTNGNACTQVPDGTAACDHIYEHGIPVQGWGNKVLVSDIPQRPGSIFRVFASEDNTAISIDGSNVANINEGEFYQTQILGGGHVVSGNNPIFVVQFMTGIRSPGASNGDPAMANIVPTEQFLRSYTFSTVGGGQFNQHFVQIVAANSDLNSITLDGNPIGAGNFVAIPGSSFSSTSSFISQGTHTTSSTNGHGILVGGYNNADSYLYPGGAAFEFINPQPEDDRDGDGVLDINDECPDIFAETENGCPATGITEIHCDVPEEDTDIETFGNFDLEFTVEGTCTVHRGEDIEEKDVTINVKKDIPDFFIPEGSVVTLFDWTEESFGVNDWTVSGDGLTVVQDANGNPTFFFSPFNAFDTQFAGKIIPNNSSDDDFIGFALGFEPGDVTNSDADYLLIDWKQGTQTTNFSGNNSPGGEAIKGLAISKIAGTPDSDEFWQHADLDPNNNGTVTEIVRAINLGSIGWVDETEYEFEFVFTQNNLKVFVNGELEFDIDGNFSDGRYAFYNFSQNPVTYSGFNVSPVFDETGTFFIDFLDGSGSITVSETGTIIVDPEGPEFIIDGEVTGSEGTGDYTNIPQCGELTFDAFQGEGDFASGEIWLTPCALGDIPQIPEVEKSNGGDNQWDTRPSFGISHETRQDQIVENGFSFNSEYFTVTDNHWTDFPEQSVEIGIVNTFSATVWADKGLKIQEFLFGIPNVGEAHLAELGVEVWYDIDGEIDKVVVVQKSDVIDADTVSVSHEMTKCLSTDAEAKCDTTTVSMTFMEPLLDKVMAIKAIDWKNRDQRTFLNEGFDISGDSLNPMSSNMIPSSVRDEGLLKVTQVAKYSPHWTTEDGRIFEMNSFGSFKQINQSFERFQDTGTAYTRMHSGFGGIIAYEQNRALDIFDATSLVSELPASFAYIFPETGERITEEMRQAMLLQEQIAKQVLDEMDRQDRHY